MAKKLLMTRFPYEAVFSGEEIHTLQLAEKLEEKGYEIVFAGSCPVLLPEFVKRGFESHKFWGGTALVSKKAFQTLIFQFPLMFFSFAQLAYFAKFKWKVDRVYMLSLNEKLFLTPWLRLLGIKSVWVEHARIGDWLEKNPFLFAYKRLSRVVRIIAVSQQTKKKLVELGVREKSVKFVLNGVYRPAVVHPAEGGLQEKRMTKRVGLITRLYEDKGVGYFLGALRELVKVYPEIEVEIVGEGPCERELKHFAKDLPVRFLGKVEHAKIAEFLKRLDYFVLPSVQHDPFGLAPAEAMMCGKPVIVTDVCGITDFMDNEKEGLIIRAKDAKAIEKALVRLFEDEELSGRIAENGKRLAEKKFSLERMVEEYEEIVFG